VASRRSSGQVVGAAWAGLHHFAGAWKQDSGRATAVSPHFRAQASLERSPETPLFKAFLCSTQQLCPSHAIKSISAESHLVVQSFVPVKFQLDL